LSSYPYFLDPEEIDIESQLDQPPILRNRKQNTSFRHAVDRSFYPTSTTTTTAADTTTAYYNSFDTNASPSSAPPIPPHRPRSESGTRDKLSNNPQHKNSSKTKNSNPLPEKSTGSILFSSSPSVYKTIDKLERAHSKSRPEIHSNNSVLVKDSKSSSHSISNNNPPTEQKHSKSGRISLKNLFRIGNSKTESELNGDYSLHNSNQSKPTSETSTILSKKQLRRLSVPEYQITSNLLTSTKLIDKIHEKNSYNNPTSTTTTTSTIPSVQQIFNHSSSQSKLSNTTHHMDSNVICNDSMYKTISPNIMNNNHHTNYKTISVNHPYCPPPDISPPPLPPRVSYTTPPILTMKSNHSKMIKYRPLPEERSNNDPRMIDETKQNRRKKSSYSMTTSVILSHSTTHQSKSSPKITSTASSPTYCLALNTVDPTVLSTSIKKSNFGHDDNNALVTNDNSRSRRRRHHHHYEHHKNSNQQDGILSESSTKSQTPAIYMNSKQIDKDYKKSTPSPHRSRSTHARLPLNKSQHNNHDNITTTTTNTVATIMSTTNSPESIHYYQAPVISSHSAMSTPRRLQDGRKSEYHINNRKQQITMQEASLIVSFPMDKLITPKHSSIHHQH
uniref:DH domain-containing protein n=1 Tax=Schistosoma curassoni TaxID=6186 RepID=A0A183KKY5_9TREM